MTPFPSCRLRVLFFFNCVTLRAGEFHGLIFHVAVAVVKIPGNVVFIGTGGIPNTKRTRTGMQNNT